MSFKQLLKSLVLTASLVCAPITALAGATATASLTVEDFVVLVNVGSPEEPFYVPADFVPGLVTVEDLDFFGSSASTGPVVDPIEDHFPATESEFDEDDLGYPNFDLLAVDGTNSGSAVFDGFATTAGGASGTTYAHAEVAGTGLAAAESNIENTATIVIDDGVSGAPSEIDFALSFSFIFELIADSTVPYEVGFAESSAGLSVLLAGASGVIFESIFSFTDEGIPNVSVSDSFFAPLAIAEGTYSLFISQFSDVDVRSIPEPNALALLSFVLLGLALVARRRKI